MTDLNDAELDSILKRDPNEFIAALTANGLMGKYADKPLIVARNQKLMRLWLHHYEKDMVETIEANFKRIYELRMSDITAEQTEQAKRQGKREALASLPLRRRIIGYVVDLGKVREELKSL